MRFDIFFSISQTPVEGHTPSEAEMFRSFFRQVQAADAAGYGTAWIAEAHLSTEVQQRHPSAVVPHWRGEIGLNTDVFQLAHRIFACTARIEVGAAVMNLLCNGGPVARAEQTAAFATLHGLDPAERRRLRLGFSAGRFEFMNRAYGILPPDPLEAAAWPAPTPPRAPCTAASSAAKRSGRRFRPRPLRWGCPPSRSPCAAATNSRSCAWFPRAGAAS